MTKELAAVGTSHETIFRFYKDGTTSFLQWNTEEHEWYPHPEVNWKENPTWEAAVTRLQIPAPLQTGVWWWEATGGEAYPIPTGAPEQLEVCYLNMTKDWNLRNPDQELFTQPGPATPAHILEELLTTTDTLNPQKPAHTNRWTYTVRPLHPAVFTVITVTVEASPGTLNNKPAIIASRRWKDNLQPVPAEWWHLEPTDEQWVRLDEQRNGIFREQSDIDMVEGLDDLPVGVAGG